MCEQPRPKTLRGKAGTLSELLRRRTDSQVGSWHKTVIRADHEIARCIEIVIAGAARLDKQIAPESNFSRLRRRLRSVQVPAQNKLRFPCHDRSASQCGDDSQTDLT